MTDRPVSTARRLVAGVGPLFVLIALTGCSNDEPATATVGAATSTVGTPTPADDPSTPPTSAVGTASPSAAAPPTSVDLTATDPTPLLQEALDGAAAGYHFVTTATVGEATALTAEGDHIGASTRLTVTSNGQTVDYIVTSDGTWAGQDEVWQPLEQQAPVTDPLAALRSPSTLQTTAIDGDRVTIAGQFPASTLGVPDAEAVTVTIDVVAGALSSLSYVAPGQDPRTSVTTIITPVADPTPITAPPV